MIPLSGDILQNLSIKPVAVKQEIVLPVPEFINQPYYYDKDRNHLIKLEAATANDDNQKENVWS